MTDLSTASDARSPLAAPAVLLILIAWLAAITALAGAGFFREQDALVPTCILPFAVVPPLLFLLAHRLVPAVRAWVASLDLAVVVGLQAWRVIGILFLAFWWTGDLPGVFAIPAGVGDIAVGLLAVAAIPAVARGTLGWERRVRALIGWGLIDFATAFALAILSGEGLPLHLPGAPVLGPVLGLPLVLVPAFAVPVFAILHAVAWLRLPPRSPAGASTRGQGRS